MHPTNQREDELGAAEFMRASTLSGTGQPDW